MQIKDQIVLILGCLVLSHLVIFFNSLVMVKHCAGKWKIKPPEKSANLDKIPEQPSVEEDKRTLRS